MVLKVLLPNPSNANSLSASLALSELGVNAGSNESDVLVADRLRTLGVACADGDACGIGPGSDLAASELSAGMDFLRRVNDGVRIFFLANIQREETLIIHRTYSVRIVNCT